MGTTPAHSSYNVGMAGALLRCAADAYRGRIGRAIETICAQFGTNSRCVSWNEQRAGGGKESRRPGKLQLPICRIEKRCFRMCHCGPRKVSKSVGCRTIRTALMVVNGSYRWCRRTETRSGVWASKAKGPGTAQISSRDCASQDQTVFGIGIPLASD